ncbi:MAG: hypothetical protein WCK49_06795 [Myxococcaceae bacterium]
MTEQLENKWVAKALDNEELKEYIGFEQELKTRFTEADKQKMHGLGEPHVWKKTCSFANSNLGQRLQGRTCGFRVWHVA